MSFHVKFWGTRGSIPTPGRLTAKYGGNTTCLEIRADDTILICDAGTGIRELGLDMVQRGLKNQKLAVFFSHAHWDHIQGFPFFAPAYAPTNELTVFGHNGRQSIYSLLGSQMQDRYFPVRFDDLRAKVIEGDLQENLEFGGVKIRAFRQNHPGSSLGYSFEYQGHKVVFSTDSELDLTLQNEEEVERSREVQRRVDPAFEEFIRGADLYIGDGQYLDQEYDWKRGWGHPRVGTVVDAGVRAGVKQIAITHHDPMQSDRDMDNKIAAAQERAAHLDDPPLIFGAREGFDMKIG